MQILNTKNYVQFIYKITIMLTGIRVKLYRIGNSYKPGETISGYILFHIPQEYDNLQTTGLLVKFEGFEEIYSPTAKDSHKSEDYPNLNAKDDKNFFFFLREQIFLFGDGEDLISLNSKPKLEKYEFKFEIPEKSPASMKQNQGRVSFFISALLLKPSSNSKTIETIFINSIEFFVKDIFDLNTIPDILEPLEIKENKEITNKECSIFCCRIKGRRVTLLAKIPQKGFIGGDKLPFSLLIYNGTSDKDLSLVGYLIKSISFGEETKEQVCICKQKGPVTCSPGKSLTWHNCEFIIPAQPLSTTHSNLAKLIKVQYFILFKANESKFHSVISLQMPILIGNIPPNPK